MTIITNDFVPFSLHGIEDAPIISASEISTLGNGNCGLNAFALKLAELAALNQLHALLQQNNVFSDFQPYLFSSLIELEPMLEKEPDNDYLAEMILMLKGNRQAFTAEKLTHYIAKANSIVALNQLQKILAPALKTYTSLLFAKANPTKHARASEMLNSGVHFADNELDLLATALHLEIHVVQPAKIDDQEANQSRVLNSDKGFEHKIYLKHTDPVAELNIEPLHDKEAANLFGMPIEKFVDSKRENPELFNAVEKDGHWSLLVRNDDADAVTFWGSLPEQPVADAPPADDEGDLNQRIKETVIQSRIQHHLDALKIRINEQVSKVLDSLTALNLSEENEIRLTQKLLDETSGVEGQLSIYEKIEEQIRSQVAEQRAELIQSSDEEITKSIDDIHAEALRPYALYMGDHEAIVDNLRGVNPPAGSIHPRGALKGNPYGQFSHKANAERPKALDVNNHSSFELK